MNINLSDGWIELGIFIGLLRNARAIRFYVSDKTINTATFEPCNATGVLPVGVVPRSAGDSVASWTAQ